MPNPSPNSPERAKISGVDSSSVGWIVKVTFVSPKTQRIFFGGIFCSKPSCRTPKIDFFFHFRGGVRILGCLRIGFRMVTESFGETKKLGFFRLFLFLTPDAEPHFFCRTLDFMPIMGPWDQVCCSHFFAFHSQTVGKNKKPFFWTKIWPH